MGDFDEGYLLALQAWRGGMPGTVSAALRTIAQACPEAIGRARRVPYSRTLHGRVLALDPGPHQSLHSLVAEALTVNDAERIDLAFQAVLAVMKVSRPGDPAYEDLLAKMKADPSPRAVCLLGMKILAPYGIPKKPGRPPDAKVGDKLRHLRYVDGEEA